MAVVTLTFPGGHRTRSQVHGFEINTDYPVRLGGEESAPSPWATFLAALTSCQGIHIRNYCAEHGLPYEDITVLMNPVVSSDNPDRFTDFNLEVVLPKDFPEEHREKLVEAAQSCRVVKHLCEYPVRVNMVTSKKTE